MILLDRSRWKRGHECPRARWLEYDLGGTGIRPKAQSLPLATGSAIHAPLAEILQTVITGDLEPDRKLVRQIISKHVEQYRAACLASGFSDEPGVEGATETRYIIDEQATLIEGLVWCFWAEMLPWLRTEFEILAAEKECLYVLGCDCGLGDGVGEPSDHAAKLPSIAGVLANPGCSGIVVMLRPDFIARRKSDGSLGVWDFKSSSGSLDVSEYEHSVQMALGCLAAEKMFGESCSHYYLLGLKKGRRSRPWKQETGIKKQESVLCYGYYRSASPPVQAEKWEFEYQRGKDWSKVPIWESSLSGDGTSAETWALDVLPKEKRSEQLEILGPCQRPEHLLGDFLQQLVYEEQTWAANLAATEADGALARFPQSWNCHQWGRSCEFLPICRKYPGLESPEAALTSEQFERREPNHPYEKENR
jgi:hypothetical protein